jgi:hypothetical protein
MVKQELQKAATAEHKLQEAVMALFL